METNPNKLTPHLHIDEVNILAQIIYLARMKCLDKISFDEGDTPWSHGCRAREWTKAAIRRAVASDRYPFLSIPIDRGQSFIAAINGVPISFFYDNVNSLSKRVLRSSLPEQLSLFKNTSNSIRWRMIIQKDPSLEVVGIVLIGLNDADEVKCEYDVPLQDTGSLVYSISESLEEAVEIEEPTISEKVEKENNEEAKKEYKI